MRSTTSSSRGGEGGAMAGNSFTRLFVPLALLPLGCVAPPVAEAFDVSGVPLLSQNALAPNALAPNALAPNALAPNALAPNALAPNALAPNAFAPIQDPGLAGDLSRQLLK